MRRVSLAITLALATIVAGACGGGSSAATAGSGGTAVKVALVDTKFTPNQVTFPVNQKATLTLTNTGTVEHTFTVKDLGIDITVKPDGKPHDFGVGPFAKAGTFDLLCTVAGHKELGMTGKAVVK